MPLNTAQQQRRNKVPTFSPDANGANFFLNAIPTSLSSWKWLESRPVRWKTCLIQALDLNLPSRTKFSVNAAVKPHPILVIVAEGLYRCNAGFGE